MTRRRARNTLRQIGRQVAWFDWLPLRERISEVFDWVHPAWDQRKMQLARDYMTDWYALNQQLQLDKWERDGVSQHQAARALLEKRQKDVAVLDI